MTKLADRKTIMKAETEAHHRNNNLMIMLDPHSPDVIFIKEKGRREWLPISVSHIYIDAVTRRVNDRMKWKRIHRKQHKLNQNQYWPFCK